MSSPTPAPDGSAFLQIESLSKRFGSHAAVDDLSLSVNTGELVAFLGPSGCGKTTTLRIIAGFMETDGGRISIGGRRVDNVPARHRRMAMVFQDYALFPHMTVAANIAYGLRMRKFSKQEIKRKVAEALNFVQLSNVGSSMPRQLSGGMQQRVALARAIVVEPDLLLLDEPLSNLDAKLRKKLRVELREMHQRLGLTTLFVTHDLEEAFYLADRVAVMHDGRIEQFARPSELYSRPATPFVADFVGHTNIVRGSLQPGQAGETARFAGEGITVAVAAETAEALEGVYVVPPHRLRISLAEGQIGARANSVEGTVRIVSYLGPVRSVLVEVGDLTFQCDVPEDDETGNNLAVGQRVWLNWDIEAGSFVRD